ncbi:hypothetical protein J4441_00755 [Candidatus Micrarchaeota archaeon]|nr:hypothetical protein [Candidatus Micrarchaeota archaeon]
MAKKGGSPHYLRIRAPNSLAIKGKKENRWLLAPSPGPHPKGASITLGVLLRDVLKVVSDLRECKKVLRAKRVLVNSIARTEAKFPIGLMDVVSLPLEGKSYRMTIRARKLQPVEISAENAKKHFLKVVGKSTISGGKTCITFHNGRNMLADNDIKVGDTAVLDDGAKMSQVIKLKSGARCLITSGKHAGEIAQFEGLIERKGSMDAEAKLKGTQESFVTVAKYLFAVDDSFN